MRRTDEAIKESVQSNKRERESRTSVMIRFTSAASHSPPFASPSDRRRRGRHGESHDDDDDDDWRIKRPKRDVRLNSLRLFCGLLAAGAGCSRQIWELSVSSPIGVEFARAKQPTKVRACTYQLLILPSVVTGAAAFASAAADGTKCSSSGRRKDKERLFVGGAGRVWPPKQPLTGCSGVASKQCHQQGETSQSRGARCSRRRGRAGRRSRRSIRSLSSNRALLWELATYFRAGHCSSLARRLTTSRGFGRPSVPASVSKRARARALLAACQ